MTDNTLQPIDLTPASRAVRIIGENINHAVLCADSAPEALSILDMVTVISSRLRELKAQAEAKCIELIDRDGEYVAGEVRYYVGLDKRTKPRDKAAVLDAIFQLAEGDVAKTAEYFSADPFKPGAIRAALETAENFNAPAFDALFETTEVMDLREGKPRRSLKSHNPAMSG